MNKIISTIVPIFPVIIFGSILCSRGFFPKEFRRPANDLVYPNNTKATLIQSSIHGNLGYIGFAVAYYFLEKNGFAKTVIIGSILILAQNLLSVSTLECFMGSSRGSKRDQTLKIIGGVALPMALFLIGASISVTDIKKHVIGALTANLFKLIILPSTGYFFYPHVPGADCILASVSYIAGGSQRYCHIYYGS